MARVMAGKRLTAVAAAAAAALMLGTTASGIELATESFEYPTGNLSGNDGGTGWDGPWIHNPNLGQAAVAAPGLAWPGLDSAGNRAQTGTPGAQVGTNSQSFRMLDMDSIPDWLKINYAEGAVPAGPAVGAPNQTVWLSFLIQREFANELGQSGFLGFGPWLLDPNNWADSTARREKLFVGVGTNDTTWKIQGGSGGSLTNGHEFGEPSPTPSNPRSGHDPNELAHMLVRIDFRRDNANPASLLDQVHVWVNPELSSNGVAPTRDSAALFAEANVNLRFNSFRVGGTGNGGIDEIRLGTTYNSAVNQALQTTVVAADSFNRPDTQQGEPLGVTEVGGFTWGVGLNNLGAATHHPTIQNNRLHVFSSINGDGNFLNDVGAGVQNAHIQGLELDEFSLSFDMLIHDNTPADAWLGVLWNKQSTSNDIDDGYLWFVRPDGNWMVFRGLEGGAPDIMAQGQTESLVQDVLYEVELDASDGTYALTLNGDRLFSMTDPAEKFADPGIIMFMSNHGDFGAFPFVTDNFERSFGNIVLSVPDVGVPLLPGDANRDGRVDGEDFLIWQAAFGTQSGATWDDGDFNGDGRVDGEDFLIWQAHFGSVASSSAVTPEPGVLGAMMVLGSLLMMRRRRLT